MRVTTILLVMMIVAFCSLAAQPLPDPFDIGNAEIFNVNIDSLRLEAHQAYQAGQYDKSAACYLAALKYNIEDDNSLYNLACCFGLMGNGELASIYLEKAYMAGFRNIQHIKNDPDFEKVRESEKFAAIMDSLQTWDNQKKPLTGQKSYLEASSLLEYQVFLPEGYSAERQYPLIIGLHGYGGDIAGFAKLWNLLRNRQVIYVVPEAPYPLKVGEKIGYSWSLWGLSDNDESFLRSTELSIDHVLNVLDEVRTKYAINQVFLMGFSQGCILTYVTGITHPERFTGLISFGGEMFMDIVESHLPDAKNLRVFIGHGEHDNVISVESAYKAAEALEKHAIDHRLDTFDGGHQINPDTFNHALEYMGIE